MRSTLPSLAKLVGATAVAVAAASLVPTAVSATTEPPGPEPPGTEPVGTDAMTTEPMDSMAGHEMGSAPAQEVDGSADASSPEAETFCGAMMETAAAAQGDDPTAIEAAFAAVVEAAPEELSATVEAATSSDPESPEFAAAYAEIITWMQANCGYAELNLVGSEYAFGGLPADVAAEPTIVTFENIGEEVHEFVVMRINEDVELSLEELLELPEEESASMATFAGVAFAFPGDTGYALIDVTPGRYAALCFLPEGATPEIISQMEGPESSTPPGVTLGPPHAFLGMAQEFTAA